MVWLPDHHPWVDLPPTSLNHCREAANYCLQPGGVCRQWKEMHVAADSIEGNLGLAWAGKYALPFVGHPDFIGKNRR